MSGTSGSGAVVSLKEPIERPGSEVGWDTTPAGNEWRECSERNPSGRNSEDNKFNNLFHFINLLSDRFPVVTSYNSSECSEEGREAVWMKWIRRKWRRERSTSFTPLPPRSPTAHDRKKKWVTVSAASWERTFFRGMGSSLPWGRSSLHPLHQVLQLQPCNTLNLLSLSRLAASLSEWWVKWETSGTKSERKQRGYG